MKKDYGDRRASDRTGAEPDRRLTPSEPIGRRCREGFLSGTGHNPEDRFPGSESKAGNAFERVSYETTGEVMRRPQIWGGKVVRIHRCVCVDTDGHVCDHTAMPNLRFASLAYTHFLPGDLEKITGMKPALVRDWRRRDLIHESLDRNETGFSAPTAAELLLLARLSDHGIGPKRVYGWTRAFSSKVLFHALNDASAWRSAEAWNAWQSQEAERKPPERYLAVYPPPHGLRAINGLSHVLSGDLEIATVVNLESLGNHLRVSAGQPLADVLWTNGEEVA
jgi:hypothetical protein